MAGAEVGGGGNWKPKRETGELKMVQGEGGGGRVTKLTWEAISLVTI